VGAWSGVASVRRPRETPPIDSLGRSMSDQNRTLTRLGKRLAAVSCATVAFLGGSAVTAAQPALAATPQENMASIATGELNNDARNHEINGCNFYSGVFHGQSAGCPTGWHRADWCADFVKYAWRQAGGVTDLREIDSWAQSFKDYGLAHQTWHPIGSGYEPRPGDAAVYKDRGGTPGKADHVGIVVQNDSGGTTTIEGNAGKNSRILRNRVYESDLQGYTSPVVTGQPAAPVAKDVNNDHSGDAVVLAGAGMAEVRVYTQDAGMQVPLSLSPEFMAQTTRVAAGDWDGDGDSDLIFARRNAAGNVQLDWLPMDGRQPKWRSAEFPKSITPTNMPWSDSIQISVGQVVGDANDRRAELLVFTGDKTGGQARIYSNGAGGPMEVLGRAPGFAVETTRAVLADWDGDGDADVVFAKANSTGNVELHWLPLDAHKPNWKGAEFPKPITPTNMLWSDSTQISAGDVVGVDRKTEVAVFTAGPGGGQARIYGDQEGPKEVLGRATQFPAESTRMSLSDWDGDGDADLLLAGVGDNAGVELHWLPLDGREQDWKSAEYPDRITGTDLPAVNHRLA
jgi:hypothetical protein